jgi:hypothetical protein
MCSDGQGGCFVAWLVVNDPTCGSTDGADVWMCRLMEDGTSSFCLMVVDHIATGDVLDDVRVSSDEQGGAWIVCTKRPPQNIGFIHVQHVAANGTAAFGPWGLDIAGGVRWDSENPVDIDGFIDPIDPANPTAVGVFEINDGREVVVFKVSLADGGVAWQMDVTEQANTPTGGDLVPGREPVVNHDGTGGAYATWASGQGDERHICMQRVIEQGPGAQIVWSPVWDQVTFTPSLIEVPSSRGGVEVVIESDSMGGAVVAWTSESGVSAVRIDDYYPEEAVLPLTVIPPFYSWDQVNLAEGQPAYAHDLAIVSDSEDGVVVVWADHRGAGTDIYAQRLSGYRGELCWASDGAQVATGSGNQAHPAVALVASEDALSDPTTGEPKFAFAVAWEDDRPGLGSTTTVMAQRVDYHGARGCAAPFLSSLGDVPGDQGGFVELTWTRSYLDDLPADPDSPSDGDFPSDVISFYSIWRRLQETDRLRDGGEFASVDLATVTVEEFEAAVRTGARPTVRSDGPAGLWELVGTQLAHRAAEGYSFCAATRMDSSDVVGLPDVIHEFFVSAHGIPESGSDSLQIYRSVPARPWWDSNVVTAYSGDNLAPSTPLSFRATEEGTPSSVIAAGPGQEAGEERLRGTPLRVVLSWAPNGEADLRDYAIYKGPSPTFLPESPLDYIGRTSKTTYEDFDVSYGDSAYYRAAAFDVHGNASDYTEATGILVGTGVILGEGDLTSLLQNAPNPFHRETMIRWNLPREGPAKLAIYDVAGRVVRTLVDESSPAGLFSTTWDGRDQNGHPVATGVYFYRLETSRFVKTRKMAVVR